jgi:hypothetical protein
MTYRLAPIGVIRLADSLHITRDKPEWQDYRAWIKAGGAPEPMPIVAPPEPTLAELKKLRIQAMTAEALVHVQTVMPEISDLATASLIRELWLSIAPAARQPTTDMLTVIATFGELRRAIIAVRNCTTPACINSVTPTWP